MDSKPAARKPPQRSAPAVSAGHPKTSTGISRACTTGSRRYWFSESVDEFLERARAQTRQGNIAEALRLYTKALDMNPGCGRALIELGELRQALHEEHDASALYKRATAIAACAPDAFEHLAHLARTQAHDAEAIADLRLAVRLDPTSQARVQELASWYVAERAWPAALELYRKLIAELETQPTRAAELAHARIQARALSVLAGDADPVATGRADRSWVRRSIAAIAHREGLAR